MYLYMLVPLSRLVGEREYVWGGEHMHECIYALLPAYVSCVQASTCQAMCGSMQVPQEMCASASERSVCLCYGERARDCVLVCVVTRLHFKLATLIQFCHLPAELSCWSLCSDNVIRPLATAVAVVLRQSSSGSKGP